MLDFLKRMIKGEPLQDNYTAVIAPYETIAKIIWLFYLIYAIFIGLMACFIFDGSLVVGDNWDMIVVFFMYLFMTIYQHRKMDPDDIGYLIIPILFLLGFIVTMIYFVLAFFSPFSFNPVIRFLIILAYHMLILVCTFIYTAFFMNDKRLRKVKKLSVGWFATIAGSVGVSIGSALSEDLDELLTQAQIGNLFVFGIAMFTIFILFIIQNYYLYRYYEYRIHFFYVRRE